MFPEATRAVGIADSDIPGAVDGVNVPLALGNENLTAEPQFVQRLVLPVQRLVFPALPLALAEVPGAVLADVARECLCATVLGPVVFPNPRDFELEFAA